LKEGLIIIALFGVLSSASWGKDVVHYIYRHDITTNGMKSVSGTIYPDLTGTYAAAPDYENYTQVYTNLNGTGTLATCETPGNILFLGSIVWNNTESNAYIVWTELEPPPNTGTAYVTSFDTYTTNKILDYTYTQHLADGMVIRLLTFNQPLLVNGGFTSDLSGWGSDPAWAWEGAAPASANIHYTEWESQISGTISQAVDLCSGSYRLTYQQYQQHFNSTGYLSVAIGTNVWMYTNATAWSWCTNTFTVPNGVTYLSFISFGETATLDPIFDVKVTSVTLQRIGGSP
jgi:hypothetical protein